jgi:hypothetical protein
VCLRLTKFFRGNTHAEPDPVRLDIPVRARSSAGAGRRPAAVERPGGGVLLRREVSEGAGRSKVLRCLRQLLRRETERRQQRHMLRADEGRLLPQWPRSRRRDTVRGPEVLRRRQALPAWLEAKGIAHA